MICWFEGLESFLLLLPELQLSLLSWLLGKLKWRFVVLKARLFSVANESTHWLKFTKAEAFTRQCTFNGWAVHGSVKFGTIDLMVLGWWQTSSLMKVGGFWEIQSIVIELVLGIELIIGVLIAFELGVVGLEVIRLIGIHEYDLFDLLKFI